jgi:hypothetical protein
LLGILTPEARAGVTPDYSKDVSYAYYQALKLGFQDGFFQRGDVAYPDFREDGVSGDTYPGYYCFVRDAFGMDDRVSKTILRRVLVEGCW